MMRLSQMQAVVEALDDSGESPLSNEIASRWGAETGSVKLLRASANFVFFFRRSGEKCVLRFIFAEERTLAGIQAELAYVVHLAAQGILVAQPLLSLHGNSVESVSTEQGLFYAVAFEALAGPHRELSELDPDGLTEWGKALGRLHNASHGYPGTGRPTWQDHLRRAEESLPAEEQAAHALLRGLEQRLSDLPAHEANFGVIHFDFELDNLLWTDKGLGVIDLDESAHYWFAADLAFALRDLFEDKAEGVDWNNPALQHFTQGYRAVRVLEEEELRLLPLFLKLHNVLTFAKLHRALNEEMPPISVPWSANLRNRLAAKMDTYRAGFAEDATLGA